MRVCPCLLTSIVLGAAACGGAPPATSTPAPAADPHAIEPDELIVATSPVPESWTATIDGWVAKQTKPAERGEATFFFVSGSGHEGRAKAWFRSHPATRSELKPGALAACFRDAKKDDVLRAPPTPKASRDGHWAVGHVTDVAEAEQGIVKVGTTRCAIDALRVLVPPT